MSPADRRRSTSLAIALLLAIVAAIAGRLSAPSDLWDQTQPRTIAYTADMLSRGGSAWVLARDSDGLPATKPPVYNWLAAPFVAVMGRSSEVGHKAPAMLAALAIVALIVVVGERMRPTLGWLAALIWVCCYPTYKLAYLARPDMVLSCLLLVGFLASARVLAPPIAPRSTTASAAIFWVASILACWTKGPVGLLLPGFALVAALVLHRTLDPLRRLHPTWGLPLFLLLAPAWYVAAALIDPHHVVDRLWNAEVLSRVAGLGDEGGHRGPWAILVDLPIMPLYYIARFSPWSFAAVLGLLALGAREGELVGRWRRERHGRFLLLACVWGIVVVAAFSFSSGKRADYIVPAYAPAALVAAWWLLEDRFSPVRVTGVWLVPAIASVGLAAIIVVDHRSPVLPRETTDRFQEVLTRMRAEVRDRRVIVVDPRLPHLGVLFGDGPPMEQNAEALAEALRGGEPLRVLYSDPPAPDPLVKPLLNALATVGTARQQWSVELGETARARHYYSPIRLVVVDAHDGLPEEDLGQPAEPAPTQDVAKRMPAS